MRLESLEATARYRLLDEIMVACADYCEISVADLKSSKRYRVFVDARKVAVGLFKELQPNSVSYVIGAMIKRDHSSILYLVKSHKSLVLVDNNYREFYESIKFIFSASEGKPKNQPVKTKELVNNYKKLFNRHEELKTKYSDIKEKYNKIKQLTNN